MEDLRVCVRRGAQEREPHLDTRLSGCGGGAEEGGRAGGAALVARRDGRAQGSQGPCQPGAPQGPAAQVGHGLWLFCYMLVLFYAVLASTIHLLMHAPGVSTKHRYTLVRILRHFTQDAAYQGQSLSSVRRSS
jgi:hypothetical protein